MARKKNRKKTEERVPEVLWRLFGNRARTLAETFVALIPQSHRKHEAMSFLLTSVDSLDYRNLLTKCFAVVPQNAPPVTFFQHHCRWPQLEIVRRSIEITLDEQPSSQNLICCKYNKGSRRSAVVAAFTSSEWEVLLSRVGDALMLYVLRHTLLFLPLPQNQLHQIAGIPISKFIPPLQRQPRYIPEPRPLHHPVAFNGSKKRKSVKGVESTLTKKKCRDSLASDPSNSSSFVAGNGSNCVPVEIFCHKKGEGCPKENSVESRKRTRQYRWLRQRKRRQLAVQEGNRCNSDNLSPSSSLCQNDQSVCEKISDCPCCSVFKNVSMMNRNAEVDRRNIFYKLENSTLLFPRNHVMHYLKPNDSGASVLFRNIFETLGIDGKAGKEACCHSESDCPVSSICLYHSLTKHLKNIICGYKNCQHSRLLEKHCPIRSSYQDARKGAGTGLEGSSLPTNSSISRNDGSSSGQKTFHSAKAKNCKTISEGTTDQGESNMCCPKNEIVSFIWAICRKIVPTALLGEVSGWRALRRNISKFIHLRRCEKFLLKECTYKLKISKFPLFSKECGVTDVARHAIFDCWIFWFFKYLVSPLVQANFYVTESDHMKQEVLFYRKTTWDKLMREAECMKDNRYSLLDYASVRNIIWRRQFGFSRARLRPKQNGLRILTNLRAPSRMRVEPFCSNTRWKRKGLYQKFRFRYFKAVNNVLHDLHSILKGLMAKETEKLGSSVFGYNDVYRKFVPFLHQLKNGSAVMPKVFVVVSDVSKAFDSVNQDKLMSVLNDIIVDYEFPLEMLTQVNSNKKSLRIHQQETVGNQDIVTACARFKSGLGACSSDSVVFKKELIKKFNKTEVNLILKEHITRNVVQLRNKFYLQNVGIPQGSVLSPLLCSFYYEHMERNVVFPFLESADRNLVGTKYPSGASVSGCRNGSEFLLLRFIDDFFFVSTSEKLASMFFTRLERGVRDYNCFMNKEKYGANFNMSSGERCLSNRLHVGKDGTSFLAWSGLLVNCSTLEFQADYSRYLTSHLSSSLTMISQGDVRSHLKKKLYSYLRPKCHPMFYDSNINSPGVVRLNIYQVFLLCAMKFICYISNSPVLLSTLTPNFCVKAIIPSLSYMYRLIKRKIYSFEMDPAFRPKCDVKKKEVMWLGLYAYSRVIKKKQSRYKDLLKLLSAKLKPYGKVDNMPDELKYAIDDARSSVLWSIKY